VACVLLLFLSTYALKRIILDESRKSRSKDAVLREARSAAYVEFISLFIHIYIPSLYFDSRLPHTPGLSSCYFDRVSSLFLQAAQVVGILTVDVQTIEIWPS